MLCRMPRESSSSGSWRRELANALRDKRATVGVVGLGYVGLPMLVCAARAGFRAVGLDVDPTRVEALSEGRSYVSDVPNEVLADIRSSLRVSTQAERAPRMRRRPDLRSDAADRPQPRPRVHRTRGALGRRVASTGVLVVLESTTYPGTTEEVLRPILEASGLRAGRDFALAYSPERIDPGRELDHIAKTPRIVGGLTKGDGELAASFYRSFIHEVELVSTPREAEMAKLIENTFRNVNIALVNELAYLSKDLGVDLWEAIRAASTKPFGFMPFWPGPGVGGHCIAIDPSYLSWRVGQRTGHRLTFVEHAQEVNAKMPGFVAQRVSQALNDQGNRCAARRCWASA